MKEEAEKTLAINWMLNEALDEVVQHIVDMVPKTKSSAFVNRHILLFNMHLLSYAMYMVSINRLRSYVFLEVDDRVSRMATLMIALIMLARE